MLRVPERVRIEHGLWRGRCIRAYAADRQRERQGDIDRQTDGWIGR